MRGSWIAIGIIMLFIGAIIFFGGASVGMGIDEQLQEEKSKIIFRDDEKIEELEQSRGVMAIISLDGFFFGLIGIFVTIAGFLLKPKSSKQPQTIIIQQQSPQKIEGLSKEKRLELLEERLIRGEVSEKTYKKLKEEIGRE